MISNFQASVHYINGDFKRNIFFQLKTQQLALAVELQTLSGLLLWVELPRTFYLRWHQDKLLKEWAQGF